MDLSRTKSQSRSVQFMYEGSPTTLSGSFNMTTISIRSALEGMGDADNGYHSPSFDEFCGKVEEFRLLHRIVFDPIEHCWLIAGRVGPGIGGESIDDVNDFNLD
jgi:hypothetical protein